MTALALAPGLWLAPAAAGSAAILVTGQVLGPEGTPLAGARVELTALPDTYAQSLAEVRGEPRTTARTLTDTRGRFRIAAPEEGMWRLRVTAAGYTPAERSLLPLVEALSLAPVRLEPDRGLMVRVVDGAGAPVAFARTLAWPLPGTRYDSPNRDGWHAADRRGRTDASGTVRLLRGPGEALILQVRIPGGELAAQVEAPARTGDEVIVTLGEGRVRHLRLQDPGGRPVAGAIVRLGVRLGAGTWVAGLTNDEGLVSLRLPVDEAQGMEIRSPQAPPVRTRVEAGEGLWTLTLDPGLRLTGRALDRDSGAALPGTLVWDRGDPAGYVRADTEGRFSLPVRGPAGTPLWLAAAAPGHRELEQRYQLPRQGAAIVALSLEARQAAPEEPLELGTLVLREPGATIEGWVVDGDGTAVEGAEVTASAAHGEVPGSGPRHAITDDAGFFAISDLAPGARLDLKVRAEGFVPASLIAVRPPTDEPLSIVLAEASLLSGRVLDTTGRPIEGAVVATTLEPGGEESEATPALPSPRVAASDGDGVFHFSDLEAGRREVTATHTGYRQAERRIIELSPREDLDGFDLVLESGAVVAGRVTTVDGEGIAETRIVAAASAARTMTASGPEGFYRLDGLPTGEQEISVWHDRYLPRRETMDVLPGEQRLDLVLETGLTVAGRVVDTDGSAVAGAEVMLQSLPDTSGRPGWSRNAASDVDGAFLLGGLGPGRYQLRAAKPGFATTVHPLDLEGSSTSGIDVILDTGGEVTGRLLGLAAKELAAVEVSAIGPGAEIVRGQIRSDGSYSVSNLASGEWTVAAALPESGRQASAPVRMPPGAVAVTLDLDFMSGYQISGRVLQGDHPAEGAEVILLGSDPRFIRVAETDHSGSFRLGGLLAGPYELLVEHPASGMQHQETVEVPHEAPLEILLAERDQSRPRLLEKR